MRRLLRRSLAGSAHPGAFDGAALDVYENGLGQPGAATAMINYYRAVGRKREALTQLQLLATQYNVFKNFRRPVLVALAELYEELGEYGKASDAAGELVRGFTADPELRARYARLLERSNSRHAATQAREAEFYRDNAVRPGDLREAIRP